jgi:hypothetical protein
MNEVLVDSRQLFAQDLVEHVNDFFVSLHSDTPFFVWRSLIARGRPATHKLG